MPGTPSNSGLVYFEGYDTSNNYGFWVTDGTAAGTQEITGVQGIASTGLYPYDLVVANGELIFGAEDASNNYGLWTSDGTAAGTHEITVQGTSPSANIYPNAIVAYNGGVLLSGYDPNGHYGLWTSDGTTAGTHQIMVQGASSSGLNPLNFTAYDGKILFTGTDADGNANLWVTDGTTAGTQEITGVQGANSAFNPVNFVAYNGKVLFTGTDTNGLNDLWVTDGTAAGTQELAVSGASTTQGLDPYYINVLGTLAVFAGYDASNDYNLWTSDGTAAGTHEITGVQGTAAFGLNVGGIITYNGEALFEGADPSGSNDLWVTDGTAVGTHEIIVQGTNAAGLSPSGFFAVNGKVMFTGADTNGQSGLWVTDGTSAGTQELTVSGASATYGLDPSYEVLVTAPAVTAAQAVADASGSLDAGHVITVTLTSSAAVTVDTTGGAPTLTLNDGATATYDATASTPNALVFQSTVAAGQNTPDLMVTGLSLNGATLTGTGGLALDASGLATLPGSDTGLVIDTNPPTTPPVTPPLVVTATVVTDPAQASVSGVLLQGTGAPNATVTLTENGVVAGSAQAAADGTWSFDPSTLTPGAHSLTASETDTGGTIVSTAPVSLTVPDPRFSVADLAAGTAASVIGSDYQGQVSYLQAQYGYSGADNVVLGAKVANVFLYSGAGEDALAAKAGSNVLDGGSGSNWLVGASGADGGKDTFFVDGGNGQTTWDTLLNFHVGDMLTMWGYNGASGSLSWSDNKGSASYQGATLAAKFGDAAGSSALVTFGGQSTSSSHFVTGTGTSGGLSYLAITRTA